MLTKSTVQLMAFALVGSFAATAAAQDSGALIDALVRKGVLKDQEAEQIRTQLSRDYAANTPAGKLNLSSSVKELKLSGDVRLRFQYDNQQTQDPRNDLKADGTAAKSDFSDGTKNSHDSQRDRWRLRLRVNADYKLNDNFFAGFGLQTEQKNDSGNQTMAGGAGGNGTSSAGDYFQNYPIFINKAFIGWNPVNGVTLIGGKQANPFYTTDMVWDPDINPTGFTQRVDLNKVFGFGGPELSVVAGQFIVSDGTESNVNVTNANRDSWVYQVQLIATAEVFSGVKATIAPGYYFTNNGAALNNGGGEANWVSSGTAAGVSTGPLKSNSPGQRTLSGLSVFLAPGDVSTTVAGIKTKVLWDVAYNSDASKRDTLYTTKAPGNAASVQPAGRDRLAWLAGFQLGENKKKGDWSFAGNYREVGLSAVDPNINDSDWALSLTNMAGFKGSFVYSLGDATTIGATLYTANNLRSELGYGRGTAGIQAAGPGSAKNSVQVLQIDMSVKF